MTAILLTTITATALTVYYSHSEYKKGRMSGRSFRIICVCEGVALAGLLSLLFVF